MTDFAFRICVSIDEKPTPHVNSHSNESLTSSCHQFQFPELMSHVFPCAVVEYCGVASRTVPLLMVMMSYTLASLTLPWVAMVMPSWRLLSLTAALAILPILAGWK